jgi:hypothetical protein
MTNALTNDSLLKLDIRDGVSSSEDSDDDAFTPSPHITGHRDELEDCRSKGSGKKSGKSSVSDKKNEDLTSI